jgi:hypothetical protein
VDPVPDPLLLIKLIASDIELGTSRSAARNSDHYTTEEVRTYFNTFENRTCVVLCTSLAEYVIYTIQSQRQR